MNKETRNKKQGSPLSTPEELSRRITIVDAKSKIALRVGGVLAACLLLWSLFGSVPEMVAGTGILVPPEGLMDVVCLGQGQVVELDVSPGQRVQSGEIIARVDMPQLDAERQATMAKLSNAKEWSQTRSAYYDHNIEVQGANNAERIEQLKFRMAYLNEYFTFLQQHVKGLDQLEKGFITPKEVETSRKNMQAVLAEINDCKLKIAEIQAAEMDLVSKSDQERMQSREKITELELALESVENRLKVFSNVRSPYDGVVVELGVERGDYVSPGTPVATLSPMDSPLEATLLFPVETGKKIKPGMVVYVYPSTVPKEEFGCIYGLVSSVSEYPVSAASLMKSIGTQALISRLMEQGPMLLAHVSLLRDPNTLSGFKWSSSDGPQNARIDPGTICTGSVVVKRSRPIDLVFPKFSRAIGLPER